MWTAVTDAFTSIISLIGEFLTAITSGDLVGILPLFAVGIAISLTLVCVKINNYGLAVEQLAVVTG